MSNALESSEFDKNMHYFQLQYVQDNNKRTKQSILLMISLIVINAVTKLTLQ